MGDPADHRAATDPVVLRCGSAQVGVEPAFGGRVASLQIGGHELLWNDRSAGPLGWGAYPMAPFAGRLRRATLIADDAVHRLRVNDPPHSLHGTVFDRRWQVTGRESSPATHDSAEIIELVCDLGEHWPYAGRCRQRITLWSERLRLDLEVEASSQPFPVSLGWHPWFRTALDDGAPLTMQADLAARYQRGADGLPTGELVAVGTGPFDDCFSGVRWPIGLSWGDRIDLTVSSDCAYVVIYDQQPHAWCVEPQSAPPGDTPSERVAPGRPVRATVTLDWNVHDRR